MARNTKYATAACVLLFVCVRAGCQANEPPARVGGGISAPKPLNHPNPEYSEEARAARLEGTCVLSVLVNKEGKPEDISVVRSLGMGLDEKAIEAVKAWTFIPAEKDGNPVKVLIDIAVSFRIGEGPGSPVRPALEDLRRTSEEQRRVQDRVYRVQGQASTAICGQSQGSKASISLPGIKVDASQYRLSSITFTNNKTLTNVSALRQLFPLRDGERLDLLGLSEGLRSLKRAYGSQGFAAFEATVQPTIDGTAHSVSLQVNCNEGRQFYIDRINVIGLDEQTFERVKEHLFIKPGDVYNEGLSSFPCMRIQN